MLWIKTFHLITLVCWFAGIFYLPRLFVYHAMTKDEIGKDRFKKMESKLYNQISTPAAILTIMLGTWLLVQNPSYYLAARWMQLKLVTVTLLIIYHLMCGYYLKQFREDRNSHNHSYYRWFNEVPVLLIIAIIALVVVKPF